MTYTTHGHHIRGTELGEPRPSSIARCGGPGLCHQCSNEAAVEQAAIAESEHYTPKRMGTPCCWRSYDHEHVGEKVKVTVADGETPIETDKDAWNKMMHILWQEGKAYQDAMRLLKRIEDAGIVFINRAVINE